MFLKLAKNNSSLAPGFTNKELKDQISRQRKNTRFKHQSDSFQREREGAPGRAPLSLSLKLIELLLKSRIFSLTAELIFQLFVGEAWGEQRIIFWKFKEHQKYELFFMFSMFVHCSTL